MRPHLPAEEAALPAVTIDDLNLGSDRAVRLFRAGYYEEAVQRAAQALLNEIKRLTKREDLEGENLLNHAFSAQAPLLEFSERLTPLEQDEHDGFRYLGLGMTRYLRNIVTHSEKVRYDERKALLWLGFISALREDLQLARPVSPGPDDGGTA